MRSRTLDVVGDRKVVGERKVLGERKKDPQGMPMFGMPCGPSWEIFGIRGCTTTLMYDGGTQLSVWRHLLCCDS